LNKQKAALLLAVVLVWIVAGVFLFRSLKSHPGPGPGTASTDKPVDSSDPATPAPEFKVTPAPPKGPIKDTRAGRKHYDIGVTVDRRVTHTDEGKHIFNEAVEISHKLEAPETSPEDDITNLNEVLAFYRMVFNENPVAGDNQSVMAALMGHNDRGIVVFPSDHPSLNARGELLDRWETPYYFHALSAKMMEIVSLGPDQKLGTNDDIIYTERDESDFFNGITDDPPEPDSKN
jgi:hypothetical protein